MLIEPAAVNHSLWAKTVGRESFPTLQNNLSVDLAIIGGGLSGLWSAFHALAAEPSLSIAVFESSHLGFGASGRSGGWVSSDYPVSRNTLTRRHGITATNNLFLSLKESIDAIGDFAKSHAPLASFIKSGTYLVARSDAQEKRIAGQVDQEHRWLGRSELDDLLRISGARGALFNKDSATVNPMGLVVGLARYLAARGVAIYESSPAAVVRENDLLVNSYRVTAKKVISAVEVFRDVLRDNAREQIPLYSLMVATYPLSDEIWKEIGNSTRATFAEASHTINYAQRTSDNRLALGGRGAPYPFRSRRAVALESTVAVHTQLQNLARTWFPLLGNIEFAYSWGGAIAITRDWEPYARTIDSQKNTGELGGFAGDGMTMTYLASKGLVAEMFDKKIKERNLHFIGRRSRNWEVEPLRYVAVNGLVKLTSWADREEAITKRPSLLSRIIEPLILR